MIRSTEDNENTKFNKCCDKMAILFVNNTSMCLPDPTKELKCFLFKVHVTTDELLQVYSFSRCLNFKWKFMQPLFIWRILLYRNNANAFVDWLYLIQSLIYFLLVTLQQWTFNLHNPMRISGHHSWLATFTNHYFWQGFGTNPLCILFYITNTSWNT